MLMLIYISFVMIIVLAVAVLIMAMKINNLNNRLNDFDIDIVEGNRDIEEKFNKVYRMLSEKEDKK